MLRLIKGDVVTPTIMNAFFLKLYKRLNAVDPSQIISLTTGQFLSEDSGVYSTPLNTTSEQFYATANVDVQLGRLVDDINEVIGE
jgi:hypothetical protein